MKTAIRIVVLALIVSCALACQARLNKGQAETLLKNYYKSRSSVITGPLTWGMYHVNSKEPQDLKRVYTIVGAERYEAGLSQGLMTYKYMGPGSDRYYTWENVWFAPTEKVMADVIESHEERGGERIAADVRIGFTKLGAVTDVVTKENEAKIYFTLQYSATPANELMNRAYRLTEREQPMTAFAINDGKSWTIQRIETGTI